MAYSLNLLSRSLSILLLLLSLQNSQAHLRRENGVKTEVFLSPEIVLEPGLVSDKYYYNIDFPKGHIALKSFSAELVDDKGHPIPLHQTYLHHWVVVRYFHPKGAGVAPKHQGGLGFRRGYILVRNSGVCDDGMQQYYGVGAETRRTPTDVPDPYGIEVGNPAEIPSGYEDGWMLNVHAIDTRAADDKLGCAECRCDLYNVTVDSEGQVLPQNYLGGLRCCHDGARCGVKEGSQGVSRRRLYLRYTVKYVEWDPFIVPVKIYMFDVTGVQTKAEESRGTKASPHCLVEYDVESCPVGVAKGGAARAKAMSLSFPAGGDVVYGVGHQHVAGNGITLYGEGGRTICSSNPIYGEGDEPGNEAGYVVGMSACYPSPGSVKISAGETLTLVSNYSCARQHTGVMGLFYLLVAHSSAKPSAVLHDSAQARKVVKVPNFVWPIAVCGVALVIIVVVIFVSKGKRGRGEGYQAMI